MASITHPPAVDREDLLAKMDWTVFSTGTTHETLRLKGFSHVGDEFTEMSHNELHKAGILQAVNLAALALHKKKRHPPDKAFSQAC